MVYFFDDLIITAFQDLKVLILCMAASSSRISFYLVRAQTDSLW